MRHYDSGNGHLGIPELMMPTPTKPRSRNTCVLAVVGVLVGAAAAPVAAAPHNLILFVPDGLRSRIIDATVAPTMARLRAEGVDFRNSHSLYPTFTTTNASAFATGHGIGDTGDFSNAMYTGVPIQGTVTPSSEGISTLGSSFGGFGFRPRQLQLTARLKW